MGGHRIAIGVDFLIGRQHLNSTSTSSPRTFRSPAWLVIAAIVAALFFCTMTQMQRRPLRKLYWNAIAVVSVLAALDVITRKVTVGDTALVIRRRFLQKSYSRASITEASWEGGAPVSILVEPGVWIHLPDVGSPRALVATLDSWIVRGSPQELQQDGFE